MFNTSHIIDNIKKDEIVEYKKLCKLLKISKKNDKDKLNIALDALEKLEIIRKNDKNEFENIKNENHIPAKIRCSSKGYCFAVRDSSNEDIYDMNGQWLPKGNYYFSITRLTDNTAEGELYERTFQATYKFKLKDVVRMMSGLIFD